jgi:hypothetical protein
LSLLPLLPRSPAPRARASAWPVTSLSRSRSQAVVGNVDENVILDNLEKHGGDVNACINAMLDAGLVE